MDYSHSYSNRIGSSSLSHSGDNSTKLTCPVCNRSFDTATTYGEHIKVFHKRGKVPARSKEPSFPCPDCGKMFVAPSKRDLHHDATHKGLKPHHCHICEKSFAYKGGKLALDELISFSHTLISFVFVELTYPFLSYFSMSMFDFVILTDRSDKGTKLYSNDSFLLLSLFHTVLTLFYYSISNHTASCVPFWRKVSCLLHLRCPVRT